MLRLLSYRICQGYSSVGQRALLYSFDTARNYIAVLAVFCDTHTDPIHTAINTHWSATRTVWCYTRADLISVTIPKLSFHVFNNNSLSNIEPSQNTQWVDVGCECKNSDHHASNFETKGTLEPGKILDNTNKIN